MNSNTADQDANTGAPWEVVEPAATEQAAGPAPSTALSVFDPIEQTLAAVEARHKDVVYDLTTTKGNDAARKARKELVSIRTTADEVYKTWNQPILAAQKQARELRDGFTKRVELLERPLDEAIKADEDRRAAEKKTRDDAEAARIKAIRDRIADIYAQPAACAGLPSSEIELSIVGVEVLMTDKAFYQELQGEAEAAADVVLTKLRAMMSAAKAAEELAEQQRVEADRLAAERAELERQKAELAAQQEAARIAAELAAQERQAAERKRLEDIARDERIAREAREAAEREANERLARQQRELEERREQFRAEQEAARLAELKRIADEAEAMAKKAASTPGLARTEQPGINGGTVVRFVQVDGSGASAEASTALTVTPAFGGADPTFCPGSNPECPQEFPEQRFPNEPKPPVTEQTDAFEAERQVEAARAAALPKPAIKRPDDERLTAAIAKAFDVEQAIAAEWLGTYDAFEEIARTQGVPA